MIQQQQELLLELAVCPNPTIVRLFQFKLQSRVLNNLAEKLKLPSLLEGQKNYHLNGLLYAYCAGLQQAQPHLTDALQSKSFISNKLAVIPFGDRQFSTVDQELIQNVINEGCAKMHYKQQPDLITPESTLFERSKLGIDKALSLIQAVDPDCYQEIHTLLTHVIICQSRVMHGLTCFKLHGFVFFRALLAEYHWMKYFEGLIHESAHHLLNLLNCFSPVLEKKSMAMLYDSPLRAEKRPMIGLFHAMFVMARVNYLLNKLSQHSEHAQEITHLRSDWNNAKNTLSFHDKFWLLHHSVKKHAKLTPFGKRILTACGEMVNS